MIPKKTKNYLNGTWLHKHREKIFQAVSELKTLRQIAELLSLYAEKEGKRITPQIVHTYLKRHPLSENEKPFKEKSTNPITTEKEIEAVSSMEQATDDVSHSVEIQNDDPFATLDKLGKDKPFNDVNKDKYL